MSRPTLQRWLECLSRLSLRNLYRLGDLAGFAVRNSPNQISRQTRQNISLCFADLETGEQQRLYRESIRHTCYAMIELAAIWCWPVTRVLDTITSFDICPEFGQSERARILLLPHLGSWETFGVWLGRHCGAIMLYKHNKRRHRDVDDYIIRVRARSGGTLVSTRKQGLRQLLIGLREGKSLVILPDQKPSKSKASIESRFFGYSAPTTTLVHSLCSRIECDVFLASVCRSDPPGEFGVRIRMLDHARLAADESGSAQYMNDQIEALVRSQPEQYQWAYRRFRGQAYASMK